MPLDLNGIKNQASDYLQSDDFKSLLPYLMSGGTGALVGGMLTGRRRAESGEGRGAHMRRILLNALMAGGLAGGGHYLLNKGLNSTVGAVDEKHTLSGGDEDPSPLSSAVKNIAFSPLTAAGAGATALAATDGHSFLGAGRQIAEEKLRAISLKTGTPVDLLKDMAPHEVDTLIEKARLGQLPGSKGKMLPAADISLKSRQLAGLPSAEGRGSLKFLGGLGKYKGGVSNALRRNPILSTFGQTYPRRAMRGALGLAAAGIPALIGSFLTSDNAN